MLTRVAIDLVPHHVNQRKEHRSPKKGGLCPVEHTEVWKGNNTAALAKFLRQEVTAKLSEQRQISLLQLRPRKKSLRTKEKAISEKPEDLYEKSKHNRRYPLRSCAALLSPSSSTQLKSIAVL